MRDKLFPRGPSNTDILAEAEGLCSHLAAQDELLVEQGEVLHAVAEEGEHICEQVGAIAVMLQEVLADYQKVRQELEWTRNSLARLQGSFQRFEVYMRMRTKGEDVPYPEDIVNVPAVYRLALKEGGE